MRRSASVVIGALLIGAAWAPPAVSAAQPRAPYVTGEPPQVVALEPGVVVSPILTTGDVVGGTLGGFQFSGVPDGIGTYRSGNRLHVFVNHETAFAYGDASDARVSHLTLDPDGAVVAATYAVDGSEGYQYFCSSTMKNLGGVPWYFTGEEWIGTPRGGSSIAINGLTGQVIDTPHFGKLNHENIVPVKGLSKAVLLETEDSFRSSSQLYAYVAGSFTGAIRNNGVLTVFVPDDDADGTPSTDDIAKGDVMTGRFVAIPRANHLNGRQLDAVSHGLGAFTGVRFEDATADPANPGVVYLNDTGSSRDGSQTVNGRTYMLTIDPVDPRSATLEVLLDGDDGDDIVNPDGIAISDEALVIQEDRNRVESGYGRVLVWDRSSGTLTAVARADPTDAAIEKGGGPGVWETSGALDASAFFGDGHWLIDVQAHATRERQQGPSLEIYSGVGEGGQLLLLFIPGT